MVKVKAKGTGEVAGQKVSGKKKKNEKKVLKVISKRNGTVDPKLSLKAKKKKKRNKKKKNTVNNNGTGNPEIKTAESSAAGDSESEPQESNTENMDRKGNKLENTPASNISSSTVEKTTSVTTMEEEPASTTTETQGAATKITESGETQESNKQGKKKRKKNKKKKASEALEDIEGTSEITENKDVSSEDKAEGQKGTKRIKVEEKKEVEDNAEGNKSKSKKTKNQKEKKHVLFIGNLPFDVTEDEIREHFKVTGDNIVRLTIMSRQKNGKAKGYGFIEFASAKGYDKALKLNMSQLKGRKINVEFTTPGKNSKKRKSFIKIKTKTLLGQKKGNKGKKKRSRKH